MLNSDEGRRGSEDLVASPTSTVSLIRNSRDGLVSAHQNLASLRSEAEDGGASSSTDSDESRHQYVRITNQGPINANKWESGSGSIADAATLTVLSDAISTRQNGARSSVGGTNTTFVVEPGLAISCSLVVVKGEKELGEELQAAGQHNVASLTSMSSKSDIAVPPPPPTHPEVLGIRRQSSSAAPFIRTPSISGLDPSRGVD
nr:uncharacterized protein BN887_05147 [Melanopsichium pennsylvanicum 4]